LLHERGVLGGLGDDRGILDQLLDGVEARGLLFDLIEHRLSLSNGDRGFRTSWPGRRAWPERRGPRASPRPSRVPPEPRREGPEESLASARRGSRRWSAATAGAAEASGPWSSSA